MRKTKHKRIKAYEEIVKTKVPTHPMIIFENGNLIEYMSLRTFQRIIVDLKERKLIDASVSSEGRNKGKKYFITKILKRKIKSLIKKLTVLDNQLAKPVRHR